MANQDPINLNELTRQIRLNREEGRQSLLDERSQETRGLQNKLLTGNVQEQQGRLSDLAAGRQLQVDLQTEIRNSPDADPDLTALNFYRRRDPGKAREFETMIFTRAGDIAKSTNDPAVGVDIINKKTGSDWKYIGVDPETKWEKVDAGDRVLFLDPATLDLKKEFKKGVKPGSGETITVGPEGTTITRGGAVKPGQTKGRVQADKDFAKEFVKWRSSGGSADFVKQMSQLDEVITSLESGKDLTGTIIGNTPKAILSAVNPEAVNTRELVEEVVQRNLRLILGAQFTEKEGERLIARAFNPALSEEINARRVGRLMTQMKLAAKAKDDASNYFEQFGTLTGFTGKIPTIADFDKINFNDTKTETIVTKHPDFGDVTEEDISETMRANNLTREQVLERLGQ